MEEDKQYLLRDRLSSDDPDDLGRLPRRASKRARYLDWNVGFLIANIIILIAGLAIWIRVNTLLKGFSCEPREEDFEPDLRFDTPVTFQPHPYLGGRPGNDTNDAWKILSPPGDGIVEIPNQFTGNLAVSLPAPNNPDKAKVYGVSMFHQLHCLNFLRFAYYPETVVDFPQDEIAFHRDHCLDYIRQAIMCAGDATLEPLTTLGINGMGATHQCRNFDRMFSWAYKHRSNKVNGSGYTGGRITHTPGQLNDLGEGDAHTHGHGGH
ncbi:hypothetical protein B0T19DRAFT_482180 [Cercophora scortea]|uniref:Oxidase ustYa n=1 Tax=Cercophora scortea TaxID=314031 RepID=A0AAE0IV20_9PEZI|nr:hypothetical protein B0T19DRAFT_482180 [Cercophora scortea]